MNLGELEAAMTSNIQDKSLIGNWVPWINNAILELAADFDLPALKLRTPASLAVTESDWLFDLPENFQKKLFRCADSNYSRVRRYRTLDVLDRLDLDHDEIADHVTAVAVAEGEDSETDHVMAVHQIGVYPKANDTLHLWYYKKPAVLVEDADVPACIPEPYHARVILPKVFLKAFEHLQDQVENFDPKGLQYWQGKLAAGLRGSPADGIGMINYLAKIQGGPRRHGGRDPVGARYYA